MAGQFSKLERISVEPSVLAAKDGNIRSRLHWSRSPVLCRTAGKVDNCQVGVFAAYVSEGGYALVDKGLFMPGQWFSNKTRVRGKKRDLPEDTVFRTKLRLAATFWNILYYELTCNPNWFIQNK